MNQVLLVAISFVFVLEFFLVFRAGVLLYYKIDTSVDIAKRQLEALEQLSRQVERQGRLLNLTAIELYDKKKIDLVHKRTGNLKFVEFRELANYNLEEYDVTIIKSS